MEYYHLTTPQKNIWNLQKYYTDTSIANICGAVFYREKRDSLLLQRSIRLFIQNQSGLRLRFTEKDEPRQYVSEETDIDIPIMEFSSMADFDSYVEQFAKEPIGLMNCPMYRFVVFQMGDKSGILVAVSHLISDAWTCGLMVKQFDRAYDKLRNNTDEILVEGDYIDYIKSEERYLDSERYQKDKKYWEEKYVVRPEESPIKIYSSLADSIAAKRITRTLPLSLEQHIAAYCQTHSVTPAVLFETAVILYLSKINSENEEITIGVPMLNRSNIKEKNTAGMFISTMPLTIKLEQDMTVTELARRIAIGHIDIFRHQKYPYTDILKYLREKQNFSGNLYDVMVSYQNAKTDTASDTKWYSNGHSEVPFALHIDNRDGRDSHTINVDYQTAVFPKEAEVKYIINRLEYIIKQIVENHISLIRDISILPGQEWEKVVCEFNNTAVDYPKEKCVHELFMEQAKKVPDKIALVFEEKQFTYRQLDEMSNSLAHFLREKGIGRNRVVPIIARRSWHVIVAMLGVLKAGGAYMPVDPDYPEDRIGYMIATAESGLALVYGYDGSLPVERVDLDGVDYFCDMGTLENWNLPGDLCYVIFTSGSTGSPKGVSLSHYNVNNYCNNNPKNRVCHDITRDYHKIVSVTNIIFDIFVTESWLPLVNGLTVYFANDEEAMQQRKLSGLIQRYGIEIIQTTPTKMRSYLFHKDDTEYLKNLKVIILGGEAFTADLYHELRKYTNAEIFNIYGPAETTVWSTNAKVENDNITIGTPISNTQIYILDKTQNPVPIGVAGELCIAGDGVGKGYLNRPELTAE
ncbi:MAG: AMP-binding protein, partial [Lachnoclostridium sp.]|nr:AMP-binding protein [Lachnoclostridium sp.]